MSSERTVGVSKLDAVEQVSKGSENIVVRLANVSKSYQLYDKPRDRLKQFVLPRLWRFFSKKQKCYFREFWALRDVSFELKKGETVGVIGRNGAGKSTLLQILCGTLTPTNGIVEINGRVAALLELGAGFNAEFTGRENIYMNASVLGLSKDEIDARFKDIVEFADLGDFIERPVKTYSSGMYVRLAFAVIAHVNADILIIDEALAVGDAFFVQKCMRFLRSFAETGTLLFVSHDTSAVVSLCSKAVLMDAGRVQRIGTPKEVSEEYLAILHKEDHESIAKEPDRAKTQSAPAMSDSDTIIKINPGSSDFGTGRAHIQKVTFETAEGNVIGTVVGGESVKLTVICAVSEALNCPIVGFVVKDRLGQVVFGENTYLRYADSPVEVCSANAKIRACFEFSMPVLQSGDYVIDVAIASGTQSEHIQHHWAHSAIVFRSRPTRVCFGMLAVPMDDVSLRVHV